MSVRKIVSDRWEEGWGGVAPATLLINCNSPGEGWGDCLMKEWGKSDQYRLKYSQFKA
jgi:hypothetical protein